jgi:hypothetical protein
LLARNPLGEQATRYARRRATTVFRDALVADEDSEREMYDRGWIVGVGGNRRNA